MDLVGMQVKAEQEKEKREKQEEQFKKDEEKIKDKEVTSQLRSIPDLVQCGGI